MAKLTDELRAQHKEIANNLNKVRELGIGSKEGQQLLLSVKGNLLAHLQKEDKELYPVLRKQAEIDSSLKKTMEIFAKDMESISKAAMDFFTKYAGGGSGIEFSKDFGRLFIILGGRISKEEDILYKAYDKLV